MKRLIYSWGVVTGLLVVGGCTSSESPAVPAAATADDPGSDVAGVAGTGPAPVSEKRAEADSSPTAAAKAAATLDAPPGAEPELAKAAASAVSSESDTPAGASIESILDAAIESLGEAAAIARVKTIKRTGTVHVEGEFGAFDGTTERVAVVDAQARSVMNLGDAYEQTLGWNGQTAWSKDTQAGVQDAQPYQRVQLRMVAAVSPLVPLRGGVFGAIKLLGTREFAGLTCDAVQASGPPGGTFYLDQQSKRLVGLTLTINDPQLGSDVTLVQTYADFQEHHGVLLPHKVTMEVGQDQMKLVHDYTRTELNGEIDPQGFQRP